MIAVQFAQSCTFLSKEREIIVNEKVLIKGELKNILPSCLCIALLGPVLMVIYGFISARNYIYSGVDERTYADGLSYAFGGGDGAMLVLEALAVVTIIIGIVLYFQWKKISLTVTDKRVYGNNSSGKRVDLPLDSVSAVSMNKKSTIAVTTASGAIKFTFLKNADEIHSVVSGLLIDRQTRSSTPAAPAAPAAAQSDADELKKYKDLLDSGVITQEEFDAKKKQLLGL